LNLASGVCLDGALRVARRQETHARSSSQGPRRKELGASTLSAESTDLAVRADAEARMDEIGRTPLVGVLLDIGVHPQPTSQGLAHTAERYA
jgi:hypothetical protein